MRCQGLLTCSKHTDTLPPPCPPPAGTSNQVLEQARDELQGQEVLHKESDKVLTQLHTQSKMDRWGKADLAA